MLRSICVHGVEQDRMTGAHTWRTLEVKMLLVELSAVRSMTTPGDVHGQVGEKQKQPLVMGELLRGV